MKKTSNFFAVLFVVFIAVACSNGRNQMLEDIKSKEKIVSESIGDVFDKSTAESLRLDYIRFADEYPEDSLAPIFLHKASEIAINLNMPQEAVSTLDTLIKRFPDYKYLPDAWFFKGFIQENELKDEAGAMRTYELFLEKFPDHKLAPQVKFSMDNMGVSEDELIKQFMQNTQQTDTVSLFPDSVPKFN